MRFELRMVRNIEIAGTIYTYDKEKFLTLLISAIT
jgi:hypothetical protein